ncbi:MAG: hypothetical protein ACRDF4_05600, partial [Rhabdochlamydiaceae bacterium]
MENQVEQIVIDVDAVDRKNNSIHLKNVPAMKNNETGTICVDPEDVARVEIEQIASEKSLTNSRDLTLLMMLYAKPSIAKSQDIEW